MYPYGKKRIYARPREVLRNNFDESICFFTRDDYGQEVA